MTTLKIKESIFDGLKELNNVLKILPKDKASKLKTKIHLLFEDELTKDEWELIELYLENPSLELCDDDKEPEKYFKILTLRYQLLSDYKKDTLYRLRHCYRLGIGVKSNMQKAFELAEEGYKLGCSHAALYLGLLYEKGSLCPIIEKDEKKAFEFYEYAAVKRNVHGKNNVAWCYEKGIGVQKDENKAFTMYNELTRNGIRCDGTLTATFNLAYCYDNGIGISIDKDHANDLYTNAIRYNEKFDLTLFKKLRVFQNVI